MAASRKLNIQSDDRLWTPAAAGANNLSIHQALAELVANSIDWGLLSMREKDAMIDDANSNKKGAKVFLQKLETIYEKDLKKITSSDEPSSIVDIIIEPNAYKIYDNGVGMTFLELQNALILRGASNEFRPNLRPRKGKFGMGMKSGMLALGWNLEIWTRSVLRPDTILYVKIDCRKIDDRTLTLDDIPCEEYKVVAKSTPNCPRWLNHYGHGTVIKISDIVGTIGGPTYIAEQLGLNFAPDIISKVVEIKVVDKKSDPKKSNLAGGGPCKPPVDNFDSEFAKRDFDDLDIMITPDEGGQPLKIRGWVRLLEKGRPGGDRKFGLNLYRKGQLIESYHNKGGTTGLWPTALHTNHTRIIGELHLDMCSPNYTKVGWDTNTTAWKEVKRQLKPHLQDIKTIAGKTKAGTATIPNLKAWEALFTSSIQAAKKAAISTKKNQKTSQTLVDKSKFEEKTITLKDGRKITIAAVEKIKTASIAPWTHIFEPDTNELVIYYNIESNLYKQYTNTFIKNAKSQETKLIGAWAVFDILLQVLTGPYFGIEMSEALEYRNEWLQIIFAEPGKWKGTPKERSSSGEPKESNKSPFVPLINKLMKTSNISEPELLKLSEINDKSLAECDESELKQMIAILREINKSD